MILIVRIIGIVISLIGLAFLINPALMKKFISFMKKADRIYAIGVLRLILGTIFIMAATAANCSAVITVIGILMVIGGVLVFALGKNRVTAVMEWYLKMPDSNMRLFAIVPVLLGTLILFSA
jgi:uncharacterized protein YjeT (DUF2065 family)